METNTKNEERKYLRKLKKQKIHVHPIKLTHRLCE